uniref:Uncharacterized protein n=1 Tax=Quercus lobata TaxID=97700 RepID=A0A7N2LG92_QUELO
MVRPVEEHFPFMLPINIRCNSCSQYIYQGTHLFVRKEEDLDEKYPDFESCQIRLKCTNCSAKIWIRSDPAHRDYAVVSGATKKRQVAVSKKLKREAEEGGDALKSLENTTLGSKREIAALDEMKSMESQHATVSADATLEDSPTKVAKRDVQLNEEVAKFSVFGQASDSFNDEGLSSPPSKMEGHSASFHAMRKGILTSSSTGNLGAQPLSLSKYEPWILAAAASTIDRKFVAQVCLAKDNCTF